MLLMPQKNRSRSGFMLLMLIAFTSIILGLATTFYFYCKRSQDDGSIAVKLVNQRLALTAALDYVVAQTAVNPPVDSLAVNWSTPAPSNWGVTSLIPPKNPFNITKSDPSPVAIISLKVNGFVGSSKLGWFRVTYPYFYDAASQSVKDFNYYFTGASSGQLITAPLDANNRTLINATYGVKLQNCVLIAVGCGPSQGVFSASTDWTQEIVTWYLVEIKPLLVAGDPTAGQINHVIPLFPPPQTNTPTQTLTSAGAPFYW